MHIICPPFSHSHTPKRSRTHTHTHRFVVVTDTNVYLCLICLCIFLHRVYILFLFGCLLGPLCVPRCTLSTPKCQNTMYMHYQAQNAQFLPPSLEFIKNIIISVICDMLPYITICHEILAKFVVGLIADIYRYVNICVRYMLKF